MYQRAKREIFHILFVVGLIALVRGIAGLVDLGIGVLLNLKTILQVLPFFKEDYFLLFSKYYGDFYRSEERFTILLSLKELRHRSHHLMLNTTPSG